MNREVIELFPTCIYKTKLPKSFIKYFNSLDKEEHYLLDDVSFGSRSINSYVLNNPQYLELNNFILDHCFYYGHEVLGFHPYKFRITQSWVSYKKPKEDHHAHTHPNSLISGVIFYGKNDNNSSSLIFQKPVPTINSFMLLPGNRRDKSTIGNSNEYRVPFTPGVMYLFPSYLQHTVSINETNYVRKSLAFNVMTKDKIGEEDTLTELKFNN